jgi:hypothetical protein
MTAPTSSLSRICKVGRLTWVRPRHVRQSHSPLDVDKLVFEFGRNLQGVLAGGSEPPLSSNAPRKSLLWLRQGI